MCDYGSGLTTLPSGVVASFDDALAPSSTSLRLPILTDKVKMKGKLGEGACAIVHRALLGTQKVALKVYRPGCQSTAIAEGQLLYRYQHRHICRVFGLVDSLAPHGGCALAMELMDGGSMFRLLSQQMASPHSRLYSDEDALRWMLQLASALQYLHAHDPCVVHRDLKQENIMFQKQDGQLVAKIIDFSLSTVLTDDKLAAMPVGSDLSSLLIPSMPTQGSWPAAPRTASPFSSTSPASSTTGSTPTAAAAAAAAAASAAGPEPPAATHLARLPSASPFLGPSPLLPALPPLPSPPPSLAFTPSEFDPSSTATSLLTSSSSSASRNPLAALISLDALTLPRSATAPSTPCPTPPPPVHLGTSSNSAELPHGYVQWWKQPLAPTGAAGPASEAPESHSTRRHSTVLSTCSSAASSYHLTGMTGSYAYMAPEVYNNQPYNEKSDVFSFGVMLYEVFARHLLVFHVAPRGTEAEMAAHAARTAKGSRPSRPARIALPLWALIEECWEQDPIKRPSMQQVAAALHALLHGTDADAAPLAPLAEGPGAGLGALGGLPQLLPAAVDGSGAVTAGAKRMARRSRSGTGSGCSVM